MKSFMIHAGLLCFRIFWCLALVVAGLMAALASCIALIDPCSSSAQNLPSPSGRWVASKVDTMCTGFTFSHSFSAAVKITDSHFRMTRSTKVFEIGGEGDTDMAWNDDKELVITIQDGYLPDLSLHQAGDVHIRYRVRWNPNPELHASPFYNKFRQWADANADRDRPF